MQISPKYCLNFAQESHHQKILIQTKLISRKKSLVFQTKIHKIFPPLQLFSKKSFTLQSKKSHLELHSISFDWALPGLCLKPNSFYPNIKKLLCEIGEKLQIYPTKFCRYQTLERILV